MNSRKRHRTALDDVTNSNGRTKIPLAPGKFVIGGIGVIRNSPENVESTKGSSSGIRNCGNFNAESIKVGHEKRKELSSALLPGLHFVKDVEENIFHVDGVEPKVGHLSSFNTSLLKSTKQQLNKVTPSGSKILAQESSKRSCIDSSSQSLELPIPRASNKNHPSFDAGLSFGRDCSCSFCLKAAYIWADLVYQDAKGRFLEVNKSRREASILVGKSYTRDINCESTGKNAVKFKEFTTLEFDLMKHWRSLFLHTENVLQHESSHLQEYLLKSRKLKESCKKDMEKLTGASSAKLWGPSDNLD